MRFLSIAAAVVMFVTSGVATPDDRDRFVGTWSLEVVEERDADGNWNDVRFSYRLDRSSWVALRIYPSSHTNPIFVTIDRKPIRVAESIEWSRKAVDQCWTMKKDRIRAEDIEAAGEAYDKARSFYDLLMREAGR